jgi:uncharacterized repeat protein (TIGR01451 family)
VTAPVSAGTISNTVTVTSTTTDPNPADNQDIERTTVIPSGVAEADLSIAKLDDPDPVSAGAILTYTLSITNYGPNPATAVVVTDTLPAEVTYGGASGLGWHCVHAGGVVTCTRTSLDAGVAASIGVTVTAPASRGTITNTATISGLEVDPEESSNRARTTTQVWAVHCVYLPLVRR